MEDPNRFVGLFRYMKNVFGLTNLINDFDLKRKGKQTNDADVMAGIFSAIGGGCGSLSGIARLTNHSRSVLEDFLNVDGLPRRLRCYLKAMIKRMRRGKMINLQGVGGRDLAAVDGVETMRRNFTREAFLEVVARGLVDSHCQVAVHRDAKTGEVLSFDVYHRLVVISMITDRGAVPLAWRYQQSAAGQKYANWLSQGAPAASFPADDPSPEKAKQEGELTVLKVLLSELHQEFGRRMPFDILVGDGLYDKATVLEQVEQHDVVLIAVQKDQRRILREEADADFSTRIPDKAWTELDRFLEGWSGVYTDEHLERKDQKVRMVRVKRKNRDGTIVDNYFYCSNRPWITPRLVEWCRHYRWREENGFNAWTNLWGVLKHVFHHTAAACDAMIGFLFIMVIATQNYRFGNLLQGKHSSFKHYVNFLGTC
jgi:hypothetical protein